MKIQFTLTTQLSATPEQVYNAWLDGSQHGQMTGGEASASKQVGADHAAWNEYISGRNTELVENKKIVQTWRTTEFDEKDEDSHIEIDLKHSTSGGCLLTLRHSNIAEGHLEYEQGWVDHYFKPMQDYFKQD